jgi:phosphatidylglycerophosphate synthase
MDPVLASQKDSDMLAAFWPRQVSHYITRVLVRTPTTPNQTTVLWGTLSVLNTYTVYLALTGTWIAIPFIPVIFELAFVLDCVDGEIARYKKMSNPIGGKLLDGICHRATEFALLVAFALAAYASTGSWLALPVGMLLITSDAMYVFVYERRLTALRVQAGFMGQIRQTAEGRYSRGARWTDLTRKQQFHTIAGLFHYKSVYAVIALSYLPPTAFLAGLAAVGVYKHWKWVGLTQQTLRQVAQVQAAAQPHAATVVIDTATDAPGVAASGPGAARR